MKIRILRNLGAGLPPYHEGQELDLDDDAATDLLNKGLAELTTLRTVGTPELMTSPKAQPAPSTHHETHARRGRPPASAGT